MSNLLALHSKYWLRICFIIWNNFHLRATTSWYFVFYTYVETYHNSVPYQYIQIGGTNIQQCMFVSVYKDFLKTHMLFTHGVLIRLSLHLSCDWDKTSPSDVLENFISSITSTTPTSFKLNLMVNIISIAFIIAIYTSISHNDIASCDIFHITY